MTTVLIEIRGDCFIYTNSTNHHELKPRTLRLVALAAFRIAGVRVDTYSSANNGALSLSSLTISPRLNGSFPNNPGTPTARERKNNIPMMMNAKIHWNAIACVRNCDTPSAGPSQLSGLTTVSRIDSVGHLPAARTDSSNPIV